MGHYDAYYAQDAIKGIKVTQKDKDELLGATNFWDFANENAFFMFIIVLSLISGPFICNDSKVKAQSSRPFLYKDSTKIIHKHTRMDTVTGLWKWYKIIDSVK